MESEDFCFPNLPGYRFEKLLGRGGMGSVYLARDETLQRQVAIKALDERIEPGSATEVRFLREARAMATIEHPNVARVYQFTTEGGRAFLIMEYVAGDTVADRLVAGGALPLVEALGIARQVALALEAASEKGVVHRDVKPSNILIDQRRQVRVVDFGLAKLIRPRRDDSPTGLTLAGTIPGTPHYLSPEQVSNEKVDWRSDLYSLGVVLYEMVTGERPFAGNLFEILHAHVAERFPPLFRRVPAASQEVERLVAWLGEKKPTERPASFPELLAAIDSAIASVSGAVAAPERDTEEMATGASRPTSRPGSRWRRWALASAIAAATAAAMVALWQYRTPWPPGPAQADEASRDVAPGATVGMRRSIAVFDFENLSGKEEVEWLATAFSEMLTSELGAGGRLRTIARQNVDRTRRDLALRVGGTLAGDTLEKVRAALGSDLVVTGTFVAVLGDRWRLRFDLSVQETTSGEITATLTEEGMIDGIFELVSRMGRRLRAQLGVEEIAVTVSEQVLAQHSTNPEALRLYAEGIRQLRGFHYLEARELLSQAVAADPGHPMAHAALAEAWSELGYDGKAREEAALSLKLSAALSPEHRILVEGRCDEMFQRWDEAIESYRALRRFYRDNVDYGLDLARALTEDNRGRQALEVVAQLRQLPAPSAEDLRIDLAEATAAESLSEYERMLAAGSRAVDKGQAQGSRLLVARAHLLRGLALLRLGRPREAVPAVDRARQIFAVAGDRSGEADALNRVANIAYEEGNYRSAEETFEEALKIWREVGNLDGTPTALNNVADTLMMQGRLKDARPLFDRALEMVREMGDEEFEGFLLINLGELHFRSGDLSAAQSKGEKGLELTLAADYHYGSYMGYWVLGNVALEAGQLAAAEEKLTQGLTLAVDSGERRYTAYLQFSLGQVAMVRGDLGRARQRHEAALEIRRDELGSLTEAAESQVALALLAVAEGRLPVDPSALQEAIATFEQRNLAEGVLQARTALATVLAAQGQTAAASAESRQAESLLDWCETVPVRLRSTIRIARVEAGDGRRAAAVARLRAVIAEAEGFGLVLIKDQARLAQGEIEADDGAATRPH